MTARLRVVLDQVVSATSDDLADASRSLLAALIESTPSGCDVAGILPASGVTDVSSRATFDALADVWTASVPRRELAGAWRIGAPLGAGGGMIHSPSLMAPLVRHDRAHDHDQTVVTVWSLEAWTAPERLPRAEVSWQRAMLKRAVRFADAVVVPTHAMAEELGELAAFGGRIRVISGAPPEGFGVPSDAAGRARTLELPERYVTVLGRPEGSDGLDHAFRALADMDLDVVVVGGGVGVGVGENGSARLRDLATTAGLSERRLHLPVTGDLSDRAVILSGAVSVIAGSPAPVFPWRALEALAVGAPLIAVSTPQNEELLADGAHFVGVGDSDEMREALRRVVGDDAFASRLRVLSADRARAFSWRDAADRVWQLHAEL